MIRFKHAGVGFVVMVCATGAPACSSDSDGGSPSGATGGYPSSSGGASVTGGASGAGGVTTSGGASAGGGTIGASGGTAGASGGVIGGGGTAGTGGGSVTTGQCVDASKITKPSTSTAATCPNTPTAALPAACINSCSMNGCSAAHCVPQAALPTTITSAMAAALARCPDDTLCVPDDYIVTQGVFGVKKCTSVQSAEGRCISTCVPQVNKQLTVLPQDACGDGELCAPCFNPIDGTDTTACTVGCGDAPVNSTPVTFQKCGGGQGVCVPQAFVTDPVQLQALKNVDDPTACTIGCPSGTPPACSGSDGSGPYLCAPVVKAQDQSYQFPSCTPTLASILGATTGGCVPKFLVPAGKQALVAQDNCAAGTVCAPCKDPTANNAATGACP